MSIDDRDVLPVVWSADVLAPVGKETVPERFVMFQVPDWLTAGVFVMKALTPGTRTAPGDVP